MFRNKTLSILGSEWNGSQLSHFLSTTPPPTTHPLPSNQTLTQPAGYYFSRVAQIKWNTN